MPRSFAHAAHCSLPSLPVWNLEVLQLNFGEPTNLPNRFMKLHLPSQGLMSAELGPKQHSTHPCLPLMGICCIRFSYLPVLFQENSTGLSPRLALQLQFHCRGLGQALICLAHQDLLFKRGHQLLLQTKILLTCSSPPRKSKTAGQEKGRDAKKSPSVSLAV